MRFSSLSLVLLLPAALVAADLTFTGRDVTTPVFDDKGNLTRRLTAAKATGTAALPRLETGRVEFFAPGAPDLATATLTFDHALYDHDKDRITGDKSLAFTAAARNETISGEGYVCELETGLLTLEAKVRCVSPLSKLTGDHAVCRFDPKALNSETSVKEIVVTGLVIFEPPPGASATFDRAETTLARYDAAEQKVYLKSPVTTWRKGKKAITEVGSGFWEITLERKDTK